MPRVRVVIDFGNVPISRYKDGRCFCGENPHGHEQTFSALYWVCLSDDATKIVDGGLGTDTNELWDSAKGVYYKGMPLLVCETGHLYLSHGPYQLSP